MPPPAHVKPSTVVAHVPCRYVPVGHWVLEHAVHAPLDTGEDPFRNSPPLHVGCAAHV